MTKKIFVLLALLVFAIPAFATIWRVDSNTGSNNADFTSLQAAHDGAADGDTLYLMGSPHSYGDLTLSKKLFIYGPGYWLTDNPNTQVNKNSSTCEEVRFNSGSEGSLMTGMDIDEIVYINTSTIHLKRNLISFSRTSLYIVQVADNQSDIIIEQNYIWNESTGSQSYMARGVRIGSSCTNITIKNNYIGTNSNDSNAPAIYSVNTTTSFIIANNIFHKNVDICNAVFQNNILKNGNFYGTNNNYHNNIGDAGQFGTENDNFTANMDSVFVNTGSPDGKWQLREGSPAIGAGVNGEDIGMFGGAAPYKLSGIPDIPAIYFFKAQSIISEGDSLKVNVKIKAHN